MSAGVGGLDALMKAFGPMFLGTGATTTKTSADPAAVAQQQGIFSTAMSNADNAEANTKDIVSRIIQKNAIAFAPASAAQKSAGLYNSTVLKQLAGEAQANSTAEASKAVLDYRTQNLNTAANSNAALLAANRTSTQQVAPQISPMITGALGAGALGYSAYRNRASIKSFLDDPFGSKAAAAQLETAAGLIDAKDVDYAADAAAGIRSFNDSAALGDANSLTPAFSAAGETATAAADVGQQVSDAAIDATEAFTAVSDAGSLTADVTSAFEFGGDVAETATSVADAADVASTASDALTGAAGLSDAYNYADALTPAFDVADSVSAATDVAGGFGDALSFLDAGPSPLSVFSSATHLAQGDVLGAVLSFIPGGNLIRSAVGGGSIICTELYRQGRLSRHERIASLRHFSNYKQISRDAYYVWATPSVKHLQKSPTSLYSKFLETVFKLRSSYILGTRNTKTVSAYCFVSSLSIFCGLTILPLKKLLASKNYYKKIGVAV